MTYGNYELLLADHPRIWAYIRRTEDEVLLTVSNYYSEGAEWVLPEEVSFEGWNSEVLISNYADPAQDYKHSNLRPYEAVVYRFTK
ncbi:hypothetical protein GCM10020331_022160 [Ectobacillus funiculus]